ncbi:uncharacterized protein PFLUO_LOCUS7159 [Penicillium psychrofluorescens]|uniref:uncharacterized protein n=1 Tax=Penicillium psychrofluorescens TaxID=3158075 RepID=UPI003CCE14BA
MLFNSQENKLLEEYGRYRRDPKDLNCIALEIEAQELRPVLGGYHNLTMQPESFNTKQKKDLQYQQPYLNVKGSELELVHRNVQASVPFAVSTCGYGLLWINLVIGRAMLKTDVIKFETYSTKSMDYSVMACDTPAEIEEAYASVTGYVP